MSKIYTSEEAFIREKICKQRHAAQARRGISWTLETEWLVKAVMSNPYCALSGRKLAFEPNYIETLSFDRKDSNKGYHPDNVQWTSALTNMGKNTLSDQDYIELCADVARHNGYLVEQPKRAWAKRWLTKLAKML